MELEKNQFFVLLCLFSSTHCFYFPLSTPVTYCAKQKIEGEECQRQLLTYVNRLNAFRNLLPYEYSRFDFCGNPDKNDSSPSQNLGQVVFGDRMKTSPYKFEFGVDKVCELICIKNYTIGDNDEKLDLLKYAIYNNYQHHWIIDNMPVTWCYDVADSDNNYCSTGFPIGCYVTNEREPKDVCVISNLFYQSDTFYVFNHLSIFIDYRDDGYGGAQVLRAKVLPKSINHPIKDGTVTYCPIKVKGIPGNMKKGSKLEIAYTYDITFRATNDSTWASRWGYILRGPEKLHLFSILNSFIVLLFLSVFVGVILIRNLRQDITRYNQLFNSGEKTEKEFAWKFINGDIFRPPRGLAFLSACVGMGSQIALTSFITLVLACSGLISPENRGALMTCILVLFPCLGIVGGCVATRIYTAVGGEQWISIAMKTSILFPKLVFGIVFVLNIVLWIKNSSAVIPIGTFVILLALWFCILVPLTLLGSYYGFKKKSKLPIQADPMPRPLPKNSVWTKPLPSMFVGGILPFGCIFIQLFYILNSIWAHQIYYMYGYLFLVFIILLITCIEVTLLLCYFHLRNEDYRWWWRSFLTSGFVGVYLFLYAIHYFITKLTITDFISICLYFGYTLIIVILFTLCTGSIGFLACFYFLQKITASIDNPVHNQELEIHKVLQQSVKKYMQEENEVEVNTTAFSEEEETETLSNEIKIITSQT